MDVQSSHRENDVSRLTLTMYRHNIVSCSCLIISHRTREYSYIRTLVSGVHILNDGLLPILRRSRSRERPEDILPPVRLRGGGGHPGGVPDPVVGVTLAVLRLGHGLVGLPIAAKVLAAVGLPFI